jgi:hypothetical protein
MVIEGLRTVGELRSDRDALAKVSSDEEDGS